MKVNVTMFKKVPGAEKPILDYISFRARNWDGALRKAMGQFHVTGKESSRGYLPILDIDGEFIIGQFRSVTGDDQAEYTFLMMADMEDERTVEALEQIEPCGLAEF